MILRFRFSLVAGIAAALILILSLPAGAQTAEERAGARAAAEAGADAFDQGRYQEALELFQRAEAVVHATPHLLYMARSQAQLGQLVRARENYLAIINEAIAPRAPLVLVETRADADRELEALEQRIPQITVVVQGGKTEGLQVFENNREIPAALVGIPRPVDPGSHEFYATALGSESSRTTINIKEGGQETVMLTLRPAQEAAVRGPTSEAQLDGGSSSADSSTGRILAYSALGVGVVGVGVGSLFWLQANSLDQDADDLFKSCDMTTCTPGQRTEIEALDDDSASARLLSFVGLGVGVVGLATGITLLLLDGGSDEEPEAEATVRPWVGFGSAGVLGRF